MPGSSPPRPTCGSMSSTCARSRWRFLMPAEHGFAAPWAELFTEFIDFKRSHGYLYGPDTVKRYRALARHIATFPTDPAVLTQEMVEIFLDPADRAPGTVWQRRHVVKQFAL